MIFGDTKLALVQEGNFDKDGVREEESEREEKATKMIQRCEDDSSDDRPAENFN